MASPQIIKSSLSVSRLNPCQRRRPSSKFKSEVLCGRICVRFFRIHRSSRVLFNDRFRICSKLEGGENEDNGEEPPESLFMKELKRRGMTPTSLLEENSRSNFGDDGIKFIEEEGGFSRRNAVTTDFEKSLTNQREQSMALNSEGLEGLIPRAKLLLSLGGTFFLGFGPLILVTVGFFSALYLYFGQSFIHDASRYPASPPYIDPYALLEDESISQTAPRVN